MSALPPKAGIFGRDEKGLLLTQSGHPIVRPNQHKQTIQKVELNDIDQIKSAYLTLVSPHKPSRRYLGQPLFQYFICSAPD